MANQFTKDEVMAKEYELHRAILGADIDTLGKLMHEDLLFVIPGGGVVTREIDLDTYRGGALRIDQLVPNIEKVNIIDDVAVIVLSMELRGSYHAEPFEGSYRYIRFWKQFEDGIKVIGGSGTAI